MESAQKKPNRILLWTAGLVLGSLALSLPFFDTGLAYGLRELLGDGDYQRLAVGIIAVSFGLEFLFLGAKKWTVLQWAPLLLPGAILLLGELFWCFGGWDRIVSLLLWWFGFPTLMGAGVAVFLRNLPRSRKARTLIVLVIVVLVIVAAVFWPRTLASEMTLDIGDQMLFFDADGNTEWRKVENPGSVEQMLHYCEIIYAPTAPDWNDQAGVLLRLNAEYILAAEDYETPYIYFYSGPLEDFDGNGVKWRFYYFPALYDELLGWSERTTEGIN